MDEAARFLPWLRVNKRLAVQVALSATLIYGLCWNVVAPDLKMYLFPWLSHILGAGRIEAFAEPFSNYTPPYLYLISLASLVTTVPLAVIKSLSILATLAVAFAVRCLLLPSRQANEAALLVVLLPTVLANGIVYGQCDGFWTAACLLTVASAIQGRERAMLLWFGVGFAFKAQAVFLAPFVLAVLSQRRTPPYLWAIPALVYIAAMLPAWLVGWPALDLATVYLRQAQYFNTIGTAPGPWAIVAALHKPEPLPIFWIGYVAALVASIVYVAVLAGRRLEPAQLLAAALLSAMMLPYLLPKMHERFFFLADLLAFALAYTARDRRSVAVFIGVQLASALAILGSMSDLPALAVVATVIDGAVFYEIFRYLLPSQPQRVALSDLSDGGPVFKP